MRPRTDLRAGLRAARGQAAERRGRSAERAAAWLLRLKGWRIVERRWRSPWGEIDILARRGRRLIAVEVKARRGAAEAAEALTAVQRERLARAFAAFIARRPDLATLEPRFDVVLMARWRWPRHIANAWEVSER